ncbi:ATP-binding protein [Rhodobacter ferrooxidans]|uniref:histidine kinase n=1 Tax=Rhodobacter ferrooxidans TaxID=371731 RepID=C8RY30_9RHOB|nr:ATP-binding protein [Rhodobacter sp. SW2]EEW26428.1 PAS/PAC sensor signal transduction histidine kinase [Rhodobacter sp. SW2]
MDGVRLEDVLAAVPVPVLLIDAGGRLAVANPQALAMLSTDQIGRHHGLAIRAPGLLAAIEAALLRGEAGQVRFVASDAAQEAVYRVAVTPVAAAGGRAALCAFQDTTEAELVGQVRRDFVANVSHELRTPLTALVGFIETLQGAARDDAGARERFLTIMAREAGRMNRLVQDLLQLSRVESEERLRPTEMLDIVALIRGVKATLRQLADATAVTVQMTGIEAPVLLAADADQITQVLHNLIENAVKYGGPGKTVTIETSLIARDPVLRGPGVRITVTDQGEGIDPVHLPRLTERFYRVDSHRSREMGGTGLGLAIVKHIVNRHRGRLLIDSEKGKGSRFSVILPAG